MIFSSPPLSPIPTARRRRQNVTRSRSDRYVHVLHRKEAAEQRRQRTLQRSRSDRLCNYREAAAAAGAAGTVGSSAHPQEQVVPGVPMEQHVINLRRLAQRMINPSRSNINKSVPVEHVLERTNAARRLLSIIEMEIQYRRDHRRRRRLRTTDEDKDDEDDDGIALAWTSVGRNNDDHDYGKEWKKEEKLTIELKALVEEACRAAWLEVEVINLKDALPKDLSSGEHKVENDTDDEDEDNGNGSNMDKRHAMQRSRSMFIPLSLRRDRSQSSRSLEPAKLSRQRSLPSSASKVPSIHTRRQGKARSPPRYSLDISAQTIPQCGVSVASGKDDSSDKKENEQSRLHAATVHRNRNRKKPHSEGAKKRIGFSLIPSGGKTMSETVSERVGRVKKYTMVASVLGTFAALSFTAKFVARRRGSSEDGGCSLSWCKDNFKKLDEGGKGGGSGAEGDIISLDKVEGKYFSNQMLTNAFGEVDDRVITLGKEEVRLERIEEEVESIAEEEKARNNILPEDVEDADDALAREEGEVDATGTVCKASREEKDSDAKSSDAKFEVPHMQDEVEKVSELKSEADTKEELQTENTKGEDEAGAGNSLATVVAQPTVETMRKGQEEEIEAKNTARENEDVGARDGVVMDGSIRSIRKRINCLITYILTKRRLKQDRPLKCDIVLGIISCSRPSDA